MARRERIPCVPRPGRSPNKDCGTIDNRSLQLNYRWKGDGQGGYLARPEGEDHLIDALRYAMEADSNEKHARAIKRWAW